MPRKSLLTFGMAFLSTLLLAGCPKTTEMKTATDSDLATEKENAEHAHEHKAPHGGHLIELGKHDGFAEVLFDSATKVITIYILGGEADVPLAIGTGDISFHMEHGDHEDEITLKAEPQKGDAEGKSSKFVSEPNEHLSEIKDIEGLHGHLHVKIDGKELEGELSHDHEHGDHDHDHKHEEKSAEK